MENTSDEIDLIEIAKTIWKGRALIVILSSVFVIVGIADALLSPIVYSSSTTFIPSNKESGQSSSLSGVASLVGINLGGMSSGAEIPYSMYPLVGESVEFKRLLLNTHVDDKKQIKMNDFLIQHYDIDDSSYRQKNNYSFVSEAEEKLFLAVKNIISISVNQKDGFVSISANLPESEYAANSCVNAREILQGIVINNKIKSAKQQLKYSEKQLAAKRKEFEETQRKLAYFNDSNLNIVNSSVINERERLEADFEIINAVMVELTKQVEQSKLQVSKDTPVFSVIKEATMPVHRSSPNRTQMVLIYGFVGLAISLIYTLIKTPVNQIIKEIIS